MNEFIKNIYIYISELMKGRRLLEYYKLQTGKLLLTFLLKDT